MTPIKPNRRIRVRLANGRIVYATILPRTRTPLPGVAPIKAPTNHTFKRAHKSTHKVRRANSVAHAPRPSSKAQPIPESMAGRYVALSADGLRIKGYGRTIDEARSMARSSGSGDIVIQKIPALRQLRPAVREAEIEEPKAILVT